MATNGVSPWQTPVPISQLRPSIETKQRSITGIVTLIWPYSASRSSCSFLLVEPDFRLRRKNGQVRLHFTGSSAKAVARGAINSGDQISLSLEDAEWNKEPSSESLGQIPGKSIDWELQFGERVILQILRDGQQHITIDVDHPPASPQTPASSRSPSPTTSPSELNVLSLTKPFAHLSGNAQAWSSPAFLKRKAPSNAPYPRALYDPFGDDHDYHETSRAKRTKFGRKSAEWRFAERTPSPVVEVDVEIGQQVEQQVEEEIRKTIAALQRGPPSPVSETQLPNDGMGEMLYEYDQNATDQEHIGTTPVLTEPQTLNEAHAEQKISDQRLSEEHVRFLDPATGFATIVTPESVLAGDVASDSIQESQRLTPGLKHHPSASSPVEPSQAPHNNTLDSPGRSPTTPRHGPQPLSTKFESDNLSSSPRRDFEYAKDQEAQAEDHELPFSKSDEDTPGAQTFVGGSQVGTLNRTTDEYLRQSNVGDANSPGPTLEELLHRSNQGSLGGSRRDDQKVRRASSRSVVELSSSSETCSLRDSQPPSEENSMQLERDEELDSDELSEGAYERHMTDFEDDESDGPSRLHSEAHVKELAWDGPVGIAHEEDLSEGEYNEFEKPSVSDHDEVPLQGGVVEELDNSKVQALYDILNEEDYDSEGEDRTHLEDDLAHTESDSDLEVIEGPHGQMRQGASGQQRGSSQRTHDYEEETTAEDVDDPRETSGFGFDGSAFSRPRSHMDVAMALAEKVQVNHMADPAHEGPNSLAADAQFDETPDNDLKGNDDIHSHIGHSAQIQKYPGEDKSNELQPDAASLVSPTSAGWAAFEQIQNERMTEPPSTDAGERPLQLGQASIETVKENSYDHQAIGSLQPGDENFVDDTEGPTEDVRQDEPEDYWDEDDDSAEAEDQSSELIESDISEDGEDYYFDDEDDDEIQNVYPDIVGDDVLPPERRVDNRFPVKSSTVEIVDVDSSEDEENTMTPHNPVGMSLSDPTAISAFFTGQPEMKAVKQREIEERAILVLKDTAVIESEIIEEQITESESIHGYSMKRSPRHEIRDTYSEDAGLSESDFADSPTPQPEQAISSPAENSTEHVPPSDFKDKTSVNHAPQKAVEKGEEWELEQASPHFNNTPNVGSSDTHTAQPAETEVDIRSQEGDFDRGGTQSTLTSEVDLREIADSVREDQPLHGALDEMSDDLAAASQLFENPVSDLGQDEAVMGQDESPIQLGDERLDDYAKKSTSEDLHQELDQRIQLPTPTTTQVSKQRSDLSELSESLKYETNENTLPTPSLTQKTSEISPSSTMYESNISLAPRPEPSSQQEEEEEDIPMEPQRSQTASVVIPPKTPTQTRNVSLVQKLKEMRSESAKKRSSVLGTDTSAAASPWFGPRRSSRLAKSSDREPTISAGEEEETGRDGDVSSDVDGESQSQSQPSLPRRRATSPTVETNLNRVLSSSPPTQPTLPTTGFRTTLSYFAPLNTIRSHYNNTTSVFGLVVASTSLERATTGPKDYHTTIYITDPSSSYPPSVTSARIFRPSRFAFPTLQQGDAVLLRSFRVVSYRKQLGLLSTESSAWAVFRRGEEPRIKGPPVEFGAEERGFSRGLWDWWATVEKEEFIDAVPSERNPSERTPRKGRPKGSKGSPSVLRHELRDGTTYVDRRNGEKVNSVHELRDGTRWSDSKL